MVKVGQTIRGYKVLQEFTTIGGGLSRWTFAEKNDEIYFLKEFLAPKYPKDDSPGSEKVKVQRRKRCEKFEHHHQKLKQKISTAVSRGGNLIATIDFFRHDTTYYKVTEKVDVSPLTLNDISKLLLESRVLVLKTVAHSLSILHQLNIVHGDLKPDNILIKQTKIGEYVAKLIDFDNSYFGGEPPEISEESDIVGDPVYYSPELGKYIKQDPAIKPTDLQVASDIFTLGVIYHQYLTGEMPKYNSECRYAWESAIMGTKFTINSRDLPSTLTDLMANMLEIVPENRPNIKAVFLVLKNWDKLEKSETLSPPPSENRLRGKLLETASPLPTVSRSSTSSSETFKSDEKPISRLKGKMVDKDK